MSGSLPALVLLLQEAAAPSPETPPHRLTWSLREAPGSDEHEHSFQTFQGDLYCLVKSRFASASPMIRSFFFHFHDFFSPWGLMRSQV